MREQRPRSIYTAIALAILALIVLPVAFAGAASAPEAPAKAESASVTKQMKNFKRKLGRLQRQLDAVSKQQGQQGQPGPEGPQGPEGPPGPSTGPAGGDLTGLYPNPLIRPNAVGSSELANNSVTGPKIADNAVVTEKIANSAVGSAALGFGSVGPEELQNDSVGANALKGVHAVVGNGVIVDAGTSNDAAVQCPPGETLIAGGYAWDQEEPNSIIFSAPYEANPNEIWVVRGIVDSGSNRLFAWANCLAR